MYIAIDGDDSGQKIAACYLNNDELRLRQISQDLAIATEKISNLLRENGFEIIFCAADGVAATAAHPQISAEALLSEIRQLSPIGFTFSAGLGDSLHEAYVALLNAKCLGKDRLSRFSEIAR
ncbi:mCpol domain-containing protein [Bradyrhizobium sp. UFLA05-109]